MVELTTDELVEMLSEVLPDSVFEAAGLDILVVDVLEVDVTNVEGLGLEVPVEKVIVVEVLIVEVTLPELLLLVLVLPLDEVVLAGALGKEELLAEVVVGPFDP